MKTILFYKLYNQTIEELCKRKRFFDINFMNKKLFSLYVEQLKSFKCLNQVKNAKLKQTLSISLLTIKTKSTVTSRTIEASSEVFMVSKRSRGA